MQLVKRGLIAVLLTAFFILPFVSATWDSALNVSLISYWQLNSSSGSTGIDAFDGNNLTLASASQWQTGKIGNGYFLNNTDCADTGINLMATNAGTWNFWIKRTDTFTNAGSNYFIGTEDGVSTTNGMFSLQGNGNTGTGMQSSVVDSLQQYYDVGAEVTMVQDDWYMMTLQVNETLYRWYVNGTLHKEVNLTAFAYTSQNAFFGASFSGCAYPSINAVVDEFSAWGRMLNESEISTLYASGSGITYEYTSPPVNTTLPYVTIVSPTNTTYAYQNILLNISSNGDSVWYNWNGANVSYTTPVNVSFGGGSHTLTAYANNSNGVNSSSVTFNVNIPIVCKIIGAGNYTVSGGNIIANSNSEYLGFPANVTAS
jgi:hypothetical protein